MANQSKHDYTSVAIVTMQRQLIALSKRVDLNHKQRRDVRELARRIAAAKRAVAVYKAQPKFVRDFTNMLARQVKLDMQHELTLAVEDEEDSWDIIYPQSGLNGVVGGAAVAASAAVAYGASVLGSGVKRATSSHADAARAVEDAARAVEDAVKAPSTFLGSLYERIVAAMKSFREMFGLWWLIPAGILLYAVYQCYSNFSLIISTVISLASEYLGDFWGYLKPFFFTEEVVPQSGLIDASSFVATLAACAFVPKKDPQTMVGEIMRRVGSIERSQSGLTYVFEQGLRYFERVVNFLLSLVSDKEVAWTSQTERILTAWSAKVDEFELKSTQGNPTLQELQGAMALLQEGIGFRQVVKTGFNVTFLNKYIDRLTGAIQAHRGALDQGSAFRMQPICTMLGGGSGIGKTTVMKWLAASVMLLTKAVPAQEVLSNMWQKGLSEYWNGYVQQFVYMMDDAFQQKTDGRQLDNEAMFLIRAVGNWAFPLNFADLDSKGRFYFLSPLIIGSTNVADIQASVANLVTQPDAVTRRIEHGYWIHVHPAFQRGGEGPEAVRKMLDYRKVSDYISNKRAELAKMKDDQVTVEDVLGCIPWHAWQLAPHTFSGCAPSYQGHSETLLDVARVIANQYMERKAQHDAEVTELRGWADDMASLVVAQSGLRDIANMAGELEPWNGYSDPVCEDECPESWEEAWRKEEDAPCDTPVSPWVRMRCRSPEEIKRDREEAFKARYLGAKARKDWVGQALAKLVHWLTDKGMPSWMAGVINIVDTGRYNPSTTTLAKSDSVESNLVRNVARVVRLGLFGLLMGSLFKLSSAVVSVIHDLVCRLFTPGAQSNTRDGPAKSKPDVRIPRIEAQLGTPPQDVQGDLAFNNTYKMVLEGAERKVIGQVLFVEGDLAVMPGHFRTELREEDKEANIKFISCHRSKFTMTITVADFLDFPTVCVPDTDVEFVKFDKRTLKAHRSVAHLFLQEAALKQIFRGKANNVRLDVARLREANGDELVRHTLVSNVCRYLDEATPVSGVGALHGLAVYNAPTLVGDCGAPLSICEPRYFGGASIIGIHVAGKVGLMARQGYANVISRETVYAARTRLDTYRDAFSEDMLRRGVVVEDTTPAGEALLAQSGLLGGSFLPIGVVDQPLHMGKVTKIKPSPIQECELWGPPPSVPAELAPVLRDGVRIEPMARAMEPFQAPLVFLNKADLPAVAEMAMKRHWEATMGYGRQLLTFEEAISPPENMKLKPIQRGTSPGYPYRLHGGVAKYDMFGREGEFLFDTPACHALRADVELMLDNAKLGVRCAVVFTDFLKDELRSREKVEAVATRSISGAPLDYVVLVRQYFGSFMAAMFATHTDSGMAPGINPYRDWHCLAENLTSHGQKVFGGDFKRFDAGQQPYMLEVIRCYINRWYRFNNPGFKEEDERVRDILWLDLIHSRHLTGVNGRLDTLIQWNKSLPSGHPLTTPVNSMYSLIALAYCYAKATGDYRDMWEHLYVITYGDDNANGPDDTIIDVFNQVTVSRLMEVEFGLTYTSDKKGEELVPYEPLEKVTFLKRTFRRDDEASGGWAAPLDPLSFLYTPYWFKNPRDLYGDLRKNVEQMLGELCLHDPTMWEKYHSKLREFSAQESFPLPFDTREAARTFVMNRADAWY